MPLPLVPVLVRRAGQRLQPDAPDFEAAMDAVRRDGPAAGEFLAALRRAVDVGEGLEVVVSGGLSGIAYCHPDDYGGEIDSRWDWSGRAEPGPTPDQGSGGNNGH